MTTFKHFLALIAASLIAGCSTPQDTALNDPYERTNREAHAFNKAVDKVALKPIAQEYANIMPDPLEKGISNFATNLSYPADMVNYLLQGNLGEAMYSGNAFILNTVFGLGGLFDVASANGARPRGTDFGETMARWGATEGPYVELLLLGPSTQRDAVGKIVDFALDPIGPLLGKNERQAVQSASIGAGLSSRAQYNDMIEGVYNSADSYAQARLYYLQNRRYTLGIKETQSDDPFEELYGEK